LFCLFDTLRCNKPQGVERHIWYHLKDLCKEGCTNFVSRLLDLWCECYWISKFFMNQILKLNYLLFWKIHNFCIGGSNATKQRPLHSFVHRASIHTNFMAFESLMWILLNFEGFITHRKLKNNFYLYFGYAIGIGHTSWTWWKTTFIHSSPSLPKEA